MKLDGKTNQELVALRDQITADPEVKTNRFYPPYIPRVMRKIEQIDRQIFHNLRDARIARGETVNDEGYSGRQCNRRR